MLRMMCHHPELPQYGRHVEYQRQLGQKTENEIQVFRSRLLLHPKRECCMTPDVLASAKGNKLRSTEVRICSQARVRLQNDQIVAREKAPRQNGSESVRRRPCRHIY